ERGGTQSPSRATLQAKTRCEAELQSTPGVEPMRNFASQWVPKHPIGAAERPMPPRRRVIDPARSRSCIRATSRRLDRGERAGVTGRCGGSRGTRLAPGGAAMTVNRGRQSRVSPLMNNRWEQPGRRLLTAIALLGAILFGAAHASAQTPTLVQHYYAGALS